MKEVEIINSRVEQVRSQQKQRHGYSVDDCSLPEAKNTGPSDPTEETPRFPREERNAIISVLKKFTDLLTIYRLTLDNCVRNKNLSETIDLDDNNMIIRLREDSLYVSRVLDDLIRDIEINGRYDVLIREIENNKKKEHDEGARLKEYEETRKNLEKLRKLLDEETQAHFCEAEKLKRKLIRLKNETKTVRYKSAIELEYIKAREEARTEAYSLQCNVHLERLRETIKNLSIKEKHEYRVATNIVNFLELNISEIEAATSQWQKRYERDMLTYKTENKRLAQEIDNNTEALEKLQLEYDKKQQFIDNYMAEKEAARELKKREEHCRDCAIRIQAWWRGLMVRRKLGPYRPDERKKKRSVKSKK